MKIAVLSDVHGNLPALDAVLEDIFRWGPDEVILNGDLVSRGPYSLDCLHRLRAALPGIRLLAGNHEEYVVEAQREVPEPDTPQYELTRFARFAADQLGEAELARLGGWADHLDLTDLEGGSGVHVTHGSRLGNRAGISASVPDEELPARLGDRRDLFIASHTHKPLLRRFRDTLIVNVGSVGTPMDGDPRASYGQLTFRDGRWSAEIRRLAYDRMRTERDYFDSGFMAAGGRFAEIILAEFREARVLAGPWMRRYHRAVIDGELTLDEAVGRHLEEQAVQGKGLL
ncbi:metallophosphoesterase family protein [Endothiovibrio diazotrophicus]